VKDAGLPLCAQTPVDIGGWQLRQLNSTQTETFPAGTTIQPGGYLILARFTSKAAFESYYGVTLGSNVTYLTHVSSATGVPQINGGEIFDLRGQHVRTLLRGAREAGPQRVTWDGRGDDGRGVASGVYLVRATGAGLLEFAKVALTK